MRAPVVTFMSRLGLMLVCFALPVFADDANTKAACMKTCAGSPKEATPQKLVQCLTTCEAPAADAGVSASPRRD